MPVGSSAGSLLRQARQQAGLSQAEVGLRAGVTQSVISVYESGRRQPSLPALLDLLAATGHALDVSLVATDIGGDALCPPRPLSGPLGRRVRRHRRAIKAVARAHGVGGVCVFGSVARGVDGPDSDVDLLVDLPRDASLFSLGRLRRELEELIGAPVDLVPSDGLKPDVRAEVAADLIVL